MSNRRNAVESTWRRRPSAARPKTSAVAELTITPKANEAPPQISNGNTSLSNKQPTTTFQSGASSSRELENLTILLLGETGTGKSTCINAIANYVRRKDLSQALQNQLVSFIPTSFSITDKNDKEHIIKVGHSVNECTKAAASGTRKPMEYEFTTDKFRVKLIDTPGIGDVDGVEKDKENSQAVLEMISSYDYINAICILMKSNDCRLTITFRYCLCEILLRLHKDAVSNICFLFTHTRETFYRPGNVMDVLTAFLQDLSSKNGLEVPLDKRNCYCIDNEAYRLVCAAKQGVLFSADEKSMFAESWEVSKAEIDRLLAQAARRQPHDVNMTMNLNKVRDIVAHMAKPMADMAVVIETNMLIRKKHTKELTNSRADLAILRGKARVLQIRHVAEPLPNPRIVCTARKCIRVRRIEHTEHYETIYGVCHDRCNELIGVRKDRFPEPALKNCSVMFGSGTCRTCGCDWSLHMQITYAQKKKLQMIDDPYFTNDVQAKEDLVRFKEKLILNRKREIKELQKESEIIQDTGRYFAQFLYESAIVPYDDVFEEHLKQVIVEQKRCADESSIAEIVERLEDIARIHKAECLIMKQASAEAKGPLYQSYDINVIRFKLRELRGLKHSGESFQQLINAFSAGATNNKSQSFDVKTFLHL